jgi:16S rRNA (cytidine1402-2'-O)-methyltransferase
MTSPVSLHLIPVPLSELSAADPETALPGNVIELIRTLRHFVVENAKSARAFLKTVHMPVPIAEIHIKELPGRGKLGKSGIKTHELDELLAPIASGFAVGVLSEAGCPAVADPGADLVSRAHEKNIPVLPHIGPSSILLALMGSGLGGQNFAFHGYIPQEESARKAALLALEETSYRLQQTQIVIETPYRNRLFYQSLINHLKPETLLCIAADLTLANTIMKTQSIQSWRQGETPPLDKRPAVFLFKL